MTQTDNKLNDNKNDSKSSSVTKLALEVKKTTSNQTCSKDHQLREKAIAENRVHLLKLKKPLEKRVLATQRCIYTFGEVGLEARDKTKAENIDGIIKRPPSWSDCKLKKISSKYLNSPKILQPVKDPQILNLEKQLKEIQTQKRKINQLICKELRDTKFSWQDMRNNVSLLNVRSTINPSNLANIEKLCETLDFSTHKAENFHQSFSDFINLRSNNLPGSSNIELLFGKGDVKTESLLENNGKMLEYSHTLKNSATESESEQYDKDTKISEIQTEITDMIDKVYADSENATKMFSNLNISNNLEGSTNSYNTNMLPKPSTLERVQAAKQNPTTSTQANVIVQNDITNKYPAMNSMLPEVFKSEFLKKSVLS